MRFIGPIGETRAQTEIFSQNIGGAAGLVPGCAVFLQLFLILLFTPEYANILPVDRSAQSKKHL